MPAFRKILSTLSPIEWWLDSKCGKYFLNQSFTPKSIKNDDWQGTLPFAHINKTNWKFCQEKMPPCFPDSFQHIYICYSLKWQKHPLQREFRTFLTVLCVRSTRDNYFPSSFSLANSFFSSEEDPIRIVPEICQKALLWVWDSFPGLYIFLIKRQADFFSANLAALNYSAKERRWIYVESMHAHVKSWRRSRSILQQRREPSGVVLAGLPFIEEEDRMDQGGLFPEAGRSNPEVSS